MKYIVCIIIVCILILFNTSERFIDYGTGIGPWWGHGPGLNRGYHRCICSDICVCDSQIKNYPQYYYN